MLIYYAIFIYVNIFVKILVVIIISIFFFFLKQQLLDFMCDWFEKKFFCLRKYFGLWASGNFYMISRIELFFVFHDVKVVGKLPIQFCSIAAASSIRSCCNERSKVLHLQTNILPRLFFARESKENISNHYFIKPISNPLC